jgi:glutaredoxin
MPDTSDLSLYQTQFCPYCERVRRAITRLDCDIERRDINESASHRRELVAATGRQTVPCLRIAREGGKDEWLHESLDIIAYLEKRFAG